MKRALVWILVAAPVMAAVVANRFEEVKPEERAQIEGLTAGIKKGLGKTRDAHAKGHGCVADVKVTVAVDSKVDADTRKKLAQGFFSEDGKSYDAVIRFSPGSGNPQASDHEGGGQGLALKMLLNEEDQKKLVPVAGEDTHYVDAKYYKTFDVVTISHSREFMVETISDYPAFFAASGAAAQARKAAIGSALLMGESEESAKKAGAIAAAETMRDMYINPKEGKKRLREGAILAKVGAAHPKNLLDQSYGSWVPSLLGEEAIKYEIAPCVAVDPDAYEVPESITDWKKDPNFMSRVLRHELAQKDHCFELRVQLHQDGFPSVEDAVATWPQDKSPYLKVAEIRLPKKEVGKELIDSELCEAMSFTPGHASAVHYPIGGIQRARVGSVDEKGPIEGIYTVIHKARNENRKK